MTEIDYFFNKRKLFLQMIKHWQEKHELQTDYAIDGQIQHTCLNIQEYCLDLHDKQLVGATKPGYFPSGNLEQHPV